MKKNVLKVVISRDKEGYYIADVPVLQYCMSYGDTIEDAKKNIQEAALWVLETLQQEWVNIPVNMNAPIFYEYLIVEKKSSQQLILA